MDPCRVKPCMVAELITDRTHISQLRAAYDVAFAELAREVGALQRLRTQNPHPSAVEEARHKVRKAEAAYRQCRNAISSVLISNTKTVPHSRRHGLVSACCSTPRL